MTVMEQVALRNCICFNHETSRVGLDQVDEDWPDQIEGVPDHCRRIELDDLEISLLPQTSL